MAHTVQESPAKIPGPLTLHGLSVEGVNQCVHCGLCLASCPTFSELGTEMDSPRGRIFLIKSLAEGRIALTDSVADHLSLCLDCRACETVCPAGVPYGGLIEAAKAEMEHRRPGSPVRRLFRWLNFGLLLGHPRLLAAEGPRRARVALLTGCVQAVVFGAHNRATARVLAKNGCDVVVPEGQGCCGALNAHGGDHARALALARRTIDAFEAARAEAVIVNTSGCGAHMKAYGRLLGADPAYAERARRFAASVVDLAEFLVRAPLRGPLSPVPLTVTYHDPCHVVHGQKLRGEPRRLLAQIPGLRIVELTESDWCCGSAGIYNLTQPEMATRLLQRKVSHVLATGADAVVTANPGCILQIQAGLAAQRSAMRVLHLVELLDRAYGAPPR